MLNHKIFIHFEASARHLNIHKYYINTNNKLMSHIKLVIVEYTNVSHLTTNHVCILQFLQSTFKNLIEVLLIYARLL